MKNLIALLFMSATLVLLVSCGGDDEDDNGGLPGLPAGQNGLTANVTGDVSATFDGTGNIGGQSLTNGTVTSSVLAVVSANTTGSALTIGINNYTGAGTYSLALTSGNVASYSQIDISNPTDVRGYAAVSGEVVITVNGNEISGTFNWVGEGDNDQDGNNETISVNGQFLIITQ